MDDASSEVDKLFPFIRIFLIFNANLLDVGMVASSIGRMEVLINKRNDYLPFLCYK